MSARVARAGAVALVVVAWAAPIRAEPEVYLNVKVSADPKDRGKPPYIEATVVDGPAGKPAAVWSLAQVDARAPVQIPAVKLRTYRESNETIAVVLLLEGHQLFIGNTSYEPEPDSQYPGILAKLIPMVDELTGIGPPGSLGAIVVYHQGAEIKLPMGPLANLTGDKLGIEIDYAGKVTRDLVTGVNEAITQLRTVTTNRKALIVVGDGADTNTENARVQLAQLRKMCDQDRIELYGLAYSANIGQELEAIRPLIPDVGIVQSADGIPSQMRAIVERINNRYYVTFPGADPQLGVSFAWDGKTHPFELRLDKQVFPAEAEPIELALVPAWNRPRATRRIPWLAILIPLAAVIAIALIMRARGRDRDRAPLPIAIVPPPALAGPTKTVMMGAGGDLGGLPVVGWIVPLDGPQAYLTYKLLQGVTRIGNAGDAHVVIHDGFMSTDHCHIVGSPVGFQLQDRGSTNGCFVNDRRVDRHDLVDNDVITFGRTHVVFKSIN